jgi:hypothetical protein
MIQHPIGPAAPPAAVVVEVILQLGDCAWMTPAAFESAENLALIAAYEHREPILPRLLSAVSNGVATPMQEPAPAASDQSRALPRR